jgi:Mg-chelatase subunit ChlD/serine/threonine protein kinase
VCLLQLPEGFTVGELGLEQRANLHLHLSMLGGVRDPPEVPKGNDTEMLSYTENPGQGEREPLTHETSSAPCGDSVAPLFAQTRQPKINEGEHGRRSPRRDILPSGVVEGEARTYDKYDPAETTLRENTVPATFTGNTDSNLRPESRKDQLTDELSMSRAMTKSEQFALTHTTSNPSEIAVTSTEMTSPNSTTDIDAAMISDAHDITGGPVYCCKCLEEDDKELAAKICHTCGGKAFCNICFMFYHKKKKDHMAQNIDQITGPDRNALADPATRSQGLEHISPRRLTPLNHKDVELQQTLARTGKPLLPIEPALFQFMRVVEDEGDAGMVVDKVINVQEEILRFCKVINASSCSFSDPSTISFKDLDHSRITVTGMYGETSSLLHFLTDNIHMNSEAVSALNTSGSELSSGIYAFLPNTESMFLFYWSKGISHSEYPSSSISCQCIRYLQRLCHSVVVLFDPDSLDSKQLNRVKHQQQEYYADMEVLHVVDCEEAVTLHPGFRVDVSTFMTTDIMSEVWNDLVFSSGKEGFIVGLPRSLKRRVFTTNERYEMSETHYREKFSQRMQNYYVDCSAIVDDDKQLCPFLRLTFPSYYNTWRDREKKCKNIEASLKEELAKLKSTVAEEHERLCKLWKEGVSYLLSELCPNEEEAFSVKKLHSKTTVAQKMEKEPILLEPFRRVRELISKDADDLQRKGAFADVLFEMDPNNEYLLRDNLLEDLFPRRISYRDAMRKVTSPRLFKRVINLFTKQGIDVRQLEKKVNAKLKKSLLPTSSFVLEKFKVAYNCQIRQYFMSPDRASIPTVEVMVHSETQKLKRQAEDDRTKISVTALRERLRTEGINSKSSKFKFRVKYFQAEKSKVVFESEEENLEKEKVAYEVYQMQINRKNLEQMQKEDKASIQFKPSFRSIEGAYVCLQKKDEHVRGLYWIQRHKKVIALVYSKADKRLSVYVGKWNNLTKNRPVRFFRKDIDAHAYDAETRLLALSNNSEKVIVLFELTECYTRLIPCKYSSRHEIGLQDLCPPSFVVDKLCFFEGECEILLAGSTAQGYIYDIKRSRIQNTCYNFDPNMQQVFAIPGYVLEVAGPVDCQSFPGQFVLNVYSKTSGELLNTASLSDVNTTNVKYIRLLDLGLQTHLLVPLTNGHLKSFVIEAVIPQSRIQFDSKQTKTSTEESQEGNSLLECFYQIFYKYPIRNSYEIDILPLILFCIHQSSSGTLEGKVRCYMANLFQELEEETGKATGPLLQNMEIVSCTKEDCSKLMWRNWKTTPIGFWTKDLISAVPIQIARAEDDRLLPLSKGMNLNLNFDFSSADMADVINAISFGLYESIFKTANVPIKVLSAKGRQSVGKSYLLNHVAGAQFDIEGGRCTHGVWMTVRVLPDTMLVVLDFEGLGSFDRTRQEDVLLSVFGAAVSNLTVFKTDCRFDRDTEVMFDRLQDGAKLLKSGERNKLFKGKLAVVVRDVSKTAAKATIEEFSAKIKLVCQTHSTNNFVCNLYAGMCRVATSQPMGSSQFLQSFEQVKKDLEEQPPIYDNPLELMVLLKTVLAKIYLQDWSPIDRTRVVQKVRQLDRILSDVAMFGAMIYETATNTYDFSSLGKLGSNSSKTIPDQGYVESLPDTGLQLLPAQDDENIPELRDSVIAKLTDLGIFSGLETGSETWLNKLSESFNKIISRRIQRVQTWIHMNTEGYTDDEEVQQLLRKAESDYFRQLRQVWSVCGEKCAICYRLCVQPEYHRRNQDDEQHSCRTDHLCPSSCSFCKDQVVVCGYVALHSGDHHCKLQSHTCRKQCHLDTLPGCNGFCSLSSDHLQKFPTSQHICDAVTHYCGKKCDLPACRNNCYFPHDVEHKRHTCNSSSGCPVTCIMEGCSAVCCSTDHFHSLDSHEDHFCDQPHPCSYPCEQDGLCGIDIQLVSVPPSKKLQKFRGRRGTYEYQLFSEQIKIKKNCGKLIPKGKFHHEGPHIHTGSRGEALPKHFCDQQCEGCLRYCEREYNHRGRHSTTHGNMSRHIFVSLERTFSVGEREYERGESAIAELCDQFCKRRGRGHTHVVPCSDPSTCVSSVHRRHNKRFQVEGFSDHILDEVTHDCYWKEMDFEDPCTTSEQENFRMCNMVCEQATVEGASPLPEDSKSRYFCQLPLWHKPVLPGQRVERGHLSVHGHHFYCTHELKYEYHTVLIIDQSGSMGSSDNKPEDERLRGSEHLQNRLGAVLVACHAFVESRYRCSDGDRYSLITFSDNANVIVSGKKVTDGLILSLSEMNLKPEGKTFFANPLALAKETVNEVAQCHPSLSPLVIMLSDGMAHDYDTALDTAKALVSACCKTKDKPIIHTIKFGYDTSGNTLLKKLATIGKGEMHFAQDQFELAEKFREFNELMTQGTVGTIRNIPPRSTGLLDKEGESWFRGDVATSEFAKSGSDYLHMLETGNVMYQICGRRCLLGKADQQNRIRPLNLCDAGTIGNSLSVVFSMRHMGQMYHLKCLYRRKGVGEDIVVSSELDCLKQLGTHRNIEAIRHSFEDRADIAYPWLDDECQGTVSNRATFLVVDSYDQTLGELFSQSSGGFLLTNYTDVKLKSLAMIVLQLSSAINHLALKGIIHGSVIEDNIYMRTPTEPVLCNFERSFSIANITAVRKAVSVKQKELGATCTAAPELAVDPCRLSEDSSTRPSIISQVIKMDIFSLGVTLCNHLLPEMCPKFPTTRPFIENTVQSLCEKVGAGHQFSQLLFSMLRRDPDLRISANDSLLACQLLLSNLSLDEGVATESHFNRWLSKTKKDYISDETLESKLTEEFLDKANYKDVHRVALLLKANKREKPESTAFCAFSGDPSLHLTVGEGDRITQIEQINSDWSFGYCHGKCGRFPNVICSKRQLENLESSV